MFPLIPLSHCRYLSTDCGFFVSIYQPLAIMSLKNSDPRIVATILAALRYFQSNREDILTLEMEHFTSDPPLSSDEIDELCEIICLQEI
jgi:hypothetical protein